MSDDKLYRACCVVLNVIFTGLWYLGYALEVVLAMIAIALSVGICFLGAVAALLALWFL